MNIRRHIMDTNTCDIRERYIYNMTSYPATPHLLSSVHTDLPGIPWIMHSFCANPCPWQPLVLPPDQVHPVVITPQPQNVNCASSPLWSSQPSNNHMTKKSFLIKDILGVTDSTSHVTSQIPGDKKCEESSKQLQNMPSSMFSFFVLPTQKERYRQLGYTRTRTMFTREQINELEAIFKEKKYLTTPERFRLASKLGLNPGTVKTWYQNKRMKWKKDMQKADPTFTPTRPKGRHATSNYCGLA